jgi:hypothetical protein
VLTFQRYEFTELPWDYLHPNHAGYNAMAKSSASHPSRLAATILGTEGANP